VPQSESGKLSATVQIQVGLNLALTDFIQDAQQNPVDYQLEAP
jgi:hypothetical protein